MNVNGATNLTVELYDQNGKVSQADSGVPVKYVVSPRQMDPQQFTVHKSAAVEFNVPSGKSFKSFILSSAPTWGGQANASLDAVIYAWNHDYDTTIKGKELGRFHEENHADNFDLEMDFGVILPPGRYVIYMTAENDTIGAYGGNMEDIDFDAVFYFDDVESWAWFPYSEIKLLNGTDSAIEVPTPEPTAEPTAKPSAEPTAGSTDKGETDAPATEDGKSDPEGTPTGDNEETAGGDGKKGMPAGAIAGIAAAAAVAVTVILKKKKA